jgi:hypothetical protein
MGCAVFAAWVGSATAGSTSAAACKAGATTVGGAKALAFCGPAKATALAAGQKLQFVQGSCEKRARYLRVDIGIRVLGTTSEPKPDYFQLVIGATPGSGEAAVTKDGTYARAVISVIKGGTEFLADRLGKVTLKGDRTKGTFTAKDTAGKLVTGSFTC